MVYRKNQLKGIMLDRTETPKNNLKPLQLWLAFKCRSNLRLWRINIPRVEICLLHALCWCQNTLQVLVSDGVHLECRQKYSNTNNSRGYAQFSLIPYSKERRFRVFQTLPDSWKNKKLLQVLTWFLKLVYYRDYLGKIWRNSKIHDCQPILENYGHWLLTIYFA